MLLVTSIILIIPGSSGILGVKDQWKFEFDNILPFLFDFVIKISYIHQC